MHVLASCGLRQSGHAFRRFASSASAQALASHIKRELEAMKAEGTFKQEKIIASRQAALVNTKPSLKEEPVQVLNMCSNNYLGWCNNPDIMDAAKKAIDARGAGLSSVRFICGTQDIHKDLEAKIAQFHKASDAILYPSCFDANAGFFEALFNSENDVVISDELNHASIIDGIRLCKAKRLRFRHSNMQDLEDKLKEATAFADTRFKVIVTDGVFSMDGELAKLKEIVDLAAKYDALVFVDECHATGILGAHGRGTAEHLGIPEDRIDFTNSTLGKALGGASGGYTVAHDPVFITWLRNRSRPYLFSNTLPPAMVGAASKALDMLLASPYEDSRAYRARQSLHENTQFVRHVLQRAGFSLGGTDHPIVPIMIGDAVKAKALADKLMQVGHIYAVAFSYPVVPKGKARIRIQISAGHEKRQLEDAVQIIIEQSKLLNIIN